MTDSKSTEVNQAKQDISSFNFEQASYNEQLNHKQEYLSFVLAPFYQQHLSVFSSPPKHYRMRAEFRVWHDGDDTFHIMFNQQTKEKYRVDQLPAASVLINNAMSIVIEFVKANSYLRTKLFQIDYLSTTSNELAISLLYHKQLDEQWEQSAHELRNTLKKLGSINIIGRARKQKVLVGNDYVNEVLVINEQAFTFKQIENSFTQPNAYINAKMIEWVIAHAASPSADLLELYCGAGNFSVPLSQHFKQVLATEISKTSVAAAQDNIANNHINNLTIARLSSEEFVEAFNKTRVFRRLADINLADYQFNTVLVDPPRAGLDKGTLRLIAQFDCIIYVSCNPTTLIDNLAYLSQSHEIAHAALFDQFPFTAHMESGVILHKKKN